MELLDLKTEITHKINIIREYLPFEDDYIKLFNVNLVANKMIDQLTKRSLNDFSDEIITKILLFIDLKNLYFIKNVCKKWKTIIENYLNKYLYYKINVRTRTIRILTCCGITIYNSKMIESKNKFYENFKIIYENNEIKEIKIKNINLRIIETVSNFKIDNITLDLVRISDHKEYINKLIRCVNYINNISCKPKISIKLDTRQCYRSLPVEVSSFIESIEFSENEFDKNYELESIFKCFYNLKIIILNKYIIKHIFDTNYKFNKEYILHFNIGCLYNEEYIEYIHYILKNNKHIKNIIIDSIYKNIFEKKKDINVNINYTNLFISHNCLINKKYKPKT